MPQYSPRRRTALVLTGTGTAGAYHAGVLRALDEAGVKLDLVAGRGMGAACAMFAAVDGGARLWGEEGFWRSPPAARLYPVRPGLRAAGWAFSAAILLLLAPLVLLALAVLVYLLELGLTLVGLVTAGAAVAGRFMGWLEYLFSPPVLPTILPRLAALAVAACLGILIGSAAAAGLRSRRRVRGPLWARVLGAPFRASPAIRAAAAGLWELIRGAAPVAEPDLRELSRRYVELLAENLGQPGFREVVLTTHDLDARRDLVLALLGEPFRRPFFRRRPGEGAGRREAETIDLAGAGRDQALNALAGALSLPILTEPAFLRFPPESYWRGETHRLCDRSDAVGRLLDEVAAAGAEQVILVTPFAESGGPHALSAARMDLRGRTGEYLAAFEAAAVRDAARAEGRRFAGLFRIRPAYNPIGPFDFTGCYDERSDRRQTLAELVDRGYEDAYRQFIEPIVGASGERLQAAAPRAEGRPQPS